MARLPAVASGKFPYHIKDFSGGMNTRDIPSLIKDNECVVATNCVFDNVGAVMKRKGYTAYVAGSVAVGTSVTETCYSKNAGDGAVAADDATWATVYGLTTGETLFNTSTTAQVRASVDAAVYYIDRGFLVFDTSYLPDTCTITGATLDLYITAKDDTAGDDMSLHIYESTQASATALALADYDAMNTTSLGNINLTSVTTGQRNVITLTTLTTISKTGYTKLAMRVCNAGGSKKGDISTGVAPTGKNGVTFYTADSSGQATYHPKLTITYTYTTPAAGLVHSGYRYYPKAIATAASTLAFNATELCRAVDGDAAWTPIAAGFSSTAKYCSFETFRDYVILANGVDTMKKWNGTELVDCNGAPTSQFVCQHKNYLFASGDSSNPSRVYWSALLNQDSWPAAQFADVGADDGERITGICRQFGNLVIFKESSIWMLYGSSSSNFSLKKIYESVGCSAPRSIAQVPQGVLFFHKTGIHIFDSAEAKPVSDKISGTIDTMLNTDYMVGTAFNDNYRLAYDTNANATSNTYVLNFDLKQTAYSVFAYAKKVCSFIACLARTDNKLLMGESLGYVYQLDNGYNDNGTAITMTWEGKHFNYKMPNQYKMVKKWFIELDKNAGTSITASYAIDGASTYTNTALTWVNGAGVEMLYIPVSKRCKLLQPKITNAVSDVATRVYSMTFIILPKKVHT